MPSYATTDIRNVVLLGQAGSGKTTLVESLLHEAGVIGAAGQVEKADTISDYSEEEKAHGCSFYNSTIHLDHAGIHVNLVDTPGSPDFVGQSLTALPAVETAVVVINAAAGVESVGRRMMERAAQ